jgi:hypothetical protein
MNAPPPAHPPASTPLSRPARIAAGLIALTGLTGLAIQLAASTDYFDSFGRAIWGMARYYTNIGNLIVALALAALALGQGWAARALVTGGVTLNAALIGIVYAVLLGRTHHPGESVVAMTLLHRVVPPLVALYWLTLVPRGALRWNDPIRWAIPPLAYFAYATVRGLFDGRFPYYFIDLATLGWAATLRNAALLTLGFMALGWLMVALDRLLARGKS